MKNIMHYYINPQQLNLTDKEVKQKADTLCMDAKISKGKVIVKPYGHSPEQKVSNLATLAFVLGMEAQNKYIKK